MYLKQIVLDGFKSYAQRTEICGFDPQFNAITGLNGSGKSNILDSICFLLGISNLSQVRAGSLQELVYKSGQAGVTKATVTITFDNRDKKQSPVGYESYDELTVSRQVVIGGRNKYLINGSNATPSRVQDLFRSVQLNVNNPHFLIMQGRITKVLNMKPLEILSMIEEAAGTRMYESKKMSAQKTIEKKDAKLKEISVILNEEITPTLRKLKEERSSYLEYQKVMRELEHLSRLSIAFQFVQAESARQQSSTELDEMKGGVQELTQQISQADSAIEEIAATVAELEKKKAKEAQGPILESEKRVKDLAMAQAVTEATLKTTKDELAAEKKNHKSLTKSFQEDKALLEAKKKDVDAGQEAYQELQERSKGAERAIQTAQQHFQAVTAGLSSNADGQEETLAAQKIACESLISAAVTETKAAQMRLASAQSELKEKEGLCKDSGHSYTQDKAKFDALGKDIAKIETAMQKIGYKDGLQKELLKKRDDLMSEVAKLKERVQALESRFPQVQFNYQSPSSGFDHSRVKGPVVKLVRVKDSSTATALEITAGGRLFNIVVDTEDTGKQLLQNGKLKRRYTIIPLNKISARAISADVVKKAQSLVGKDKARPALSLVGYEDELRPAMVYVFGSTLICDTLESAKKVTFDKQVMTRSVSLSGDVFDPSGTLTGGSRAHTSSILTKLQELLDCEGELKEKEVELRAVASQLEKVKTVAEKYHGLKEQRDSKSHAAEMVEMRMKESTHHQQLAHLQELKDTIAKQKETVKQSVAMEKSARAKLKEIQQKMKDSKSHHERELNEAEASITRAKKEAESVVKEAKSREQEMQALTLEVEELQKGLEAQQRQIDASAAAMASKTETLEEHKTANEEAKSSLEAGKKELDEQKVALRERNKELSRCEQERKDREKEKVSCALKIKELEHKITKFHKDSRDAAQRVESLLSKHDWIARDKQYFGQPNTAYDFTTNQPREVEKKLTKLQEQKDKLSKNVNMRAMNMLGKAEEKYNDLVKKKEIVENDKLKIAELITQLDHKKNEALQGAYDRVNTDFGSIFSTLLPGSRAKLSPPEGQGVLDGLEVKVGFGEVWKESLQELSGGQRSLVALSLILSLLLFKPAPVYILDEVDAALDLSHTQNIGQMLRTHFKHSQFIVVSLKDGMFNNANVLYKTKFVDGVSTVTRYVNPSITSQAGPTSTSKENSKHNQRGKQTTSGHQSKKPRTGGVSVLAPTQ